MLIFSLHPPINLSEKGKWLLAVTVFELKNSFSNITDENKNFSISTPGYWTPEDGEELINKLINMLELRSENDIELQVKEAEKSGTRIETQISGHNSACFDHFNSEILSEIKKVEYKDLEVMIYTLQLTFNEFVDILDVKYFVGSTLRYTLPLRLYEISDINLILRFLLPGNVKVKVTIDDIRLKSNLTTNKTSKFTKKSFFYIFLGFTQSHLGELPDIEVFVQLKPCTYKSDKPVNITGIDKIHLKCDCMHGSIVNGTREPILYCFALSPPPSHKIFKEPRIKFFKKMNQPVLSYITFYLEKDDRKP